jgi:hypothetical protein
VSDNILIGVFPGLDGATRARTALLEAGFPEDNVSVRSRELAADPSRSHPGVVDNRTAEVDTRSEHPASGLADWFRSLFGGDDPDDEAGLYSEAIERGEYLLTVDRVPDRLLDEAADIIDRHGAIDIEERAQRRRRDGRAGTPLRRDPGSSGVAGRLPAVGSQGIRTDVDQDFGRPESPAEDLRYRLDERGYPPLEDADPADVARLAARAAARRGKVRVYYRPGPRGGDPE